MTTTGQPDERELVARLGLLKECEVCASGAGSDGVLLVHLPSGRAPVWTRVPCPAFCQAGRRLPTLDELLDELVKVYGRLHPRSDRPVWWRRAEVATMLGSRLEALTWRAAAIALLDELTDLEADMNGRAARG
jgi:hypothetical protein